jgi:hypothetical protein
MQMHAEMATTLSLLWAGAYAIIGMAGGAYYWLGTNASTKRDTFPWFMIVCAILFLCVAEFGLQLPALPLAFVAVMLVLVTARNIFAVTFCSRCARMIDRGVLFKRSHFCPRCGAPVERSGSEVGR